MNDNSCIEMIACVSIKQKMLVGALYLAIVAMSVALLGTEWFVFSAILLSLPAILLLCAKSKDPVLAVLIWGSLFLKTALGFFQSYFGNLPDSTADATTFESQGWLIANNSTGLMNFFQNVTSVREFQYRYIASFYYLFGRFPMLVTYSYVIMGTALVYLVYKIVMLLGGNKKSAQIGALVTALFPTINLYSAVTMREAIVSFCITLSVYCFLKWCHHQKWRWLGISLVILFFGAQFHGGALIGFFTYFAYWWFYQKKRDDMNFSFLRILTFMVGGVILYYFAADFVRKLPDLERLLSAEFLADRVLRRSSDRAAYLGSLAPATLFDFIWQSPIRWFYFMFKPFPTDIQSIGDLFGLLDAALYAIMTFFVARGLWKKGGESSFFRRNGGFYTDHYNDLCLEYFQLRNGNKASSKDCCCNDHRSGGIINR